MTRHSNCASKSFRKRSPRTEADLAASFVREDELAGEELDAYRALERVGRVILRDKAATSPT
jgi:hypothetical protein